MIFKLTPYTVIPLILSLSLIACNDTDRISKSTDISHTPSESAQTETSILSTQEIDRRIDTYFSGLAETKDFSGVIRVEKNGKLLTEHRYGFANIETQIPHTDKTLYSAASITKGVLAATLVSLETDGLLSLQDNLHQYLPILPQRKNMTIEAVLQHRAGLPRDIPDGLDLTTEENGLAGWLARNPELMNAPGKEAYSNIGYALLADVIEAASGTKFAQTAQDRVLDPAGMSASFISDDIAAKETNGALPYMPGPAPSGVLKPTAAPLEVGSSGLLTTTADLAKWGRVLAKGTYPKLLSYEDPLGSIDRGEDHGHGYIAVQGSLPGYAAGVTAWPTEDISITYTTNIFSYPVVGIGPVLRAIIFGPPPPPLPERPADVELSSAHRDLAGNYTHPDFGHVIIKADDALGGMVLTMPDMGTAWTFYVTPISQGRLHWRAFNTQMMRAENGGLDAVQTRQMRDDRIIHMPPNNVK